VGAPSIFAARAPLSRTLTDSLGYSCPFVMSMTALLGWTAVLLLAGGAAWAGGLFRRYITIGPAYKAKVLCTAIFGCGRAIDPRCADEVAADTYWLLRAFQSRVDWVHATVTASFFGLKPRTAVYRPGLGATLLSRGRGLALPMGPVPPLPGTSHRQPADGHVPPALRAVVQAAFSEPDARLLRRTRAVVVVHDGGVIAEQYAPGFAAATPLPGWSMTKGVLGTLIGILVGDGRLSLDDRELLPEWRRPDARADIRLEDLLRMRSGLRFSELYSDLSSDVIQMLFNRPDAGAYAASLPLRSPPGRLWSYSSGTTNILSRIARRVVGESGYLEWPRRVLFDPIGMDSATMEPDASGTFVGSSFMFATARDWARLGQLYLQDGIWQGRRVLPEGWVRFSTTPTAESPGACYGAHWWLKLQTEMGGETAPAARIPADAFHAVGHEGQVLTVVPSRQLVVVRLGLSIHVEAWNHAAFLVDLLDALAV
jgi:hypothetical protein